MRRRGSALNIDCCLITCIFLLFRMHFIHACQGVQGSWESHIGKAVGDGGDQGFLVIAYLFVPLHMGLHLTLSTTQRTEDAECQQLSCFQIQSATCIEIAKAKSGKIFLYMPLI